MSDMDLIWNKLKWAKQTYEGASCGKDLLDVVEMMVVRIGKQIEENAALKERVTELERWKNNFWTEPVPTSPSVGGLLVQASKQGPFDIKICNNWGDGIAVDCKNAAITPSELRAIRTPKQEVVLRSEGMVFRCEGTVVKKCWEETRKLSDGSAIWWEGRLHESGKTAVGTKVEMLSPVHVNIVVTAAGDGWFDYRSTGAPKSPESSYQFGSQQEEKEKAKKKRLDIQKAVDSIPSGGTVAIPSGSHIIDSTVSVEGKNLAGKHSFRVSGWSWMCTKHGKFQQDPDHPGRCPACREEREMEKRLAAIVAAKTPEELEKAMTEELVMRCQQEMKAVNAAIENKVLYGDPEAPPSQQSGVIDVCTDHWVNPANNRCKKCGRSE